MVKQFISFFISFVPNNRIKIFLLNLLPNISIDKKSKIGFGIIFSCNKIKIINSKIGNLNFIKCNYFYLIDSKIANSNIIYKINKFYVTNFSIIGSYNFIISKVSLNKIYLKMNNSQISTNFRLILSKNLYLGKQVILGGMNTKIIDDTHKAFKTTILLRNIFIGSNAVIKNGVKINKNIVIGANTLIEKNLLLEGKYFSKDITNIN